MIFTAPTGKLITGSVLDCARKPLEARLRDLDSQLYLRWNPKKNKKWGTWEVRRRDARKSVVDFWEWDAGECPFSPNRVTVLELGWHENNFVNHILDVPHLSYDIITRLQAMDTWNKGIQAHNVVAQAERNLDYTDAQKKAKAREEMLYTAKQHRKAFRDFREYILETGRPEDIASHWNGKKSSS